MRPALFRILVLCGALPVLLLGHGRQRARQQGRVRVVGGDAGHGVGADSALGHRGALGRLDRRRPAALAAGGRRRAVGAVGDPARRGAGSRAARRSCLPSRPPGWRSRATPTARRSASRSPAPSPSSSATASAAWAAERAHDTVGGPRIGAHDARRRSPAVEDRERALRRQGRRLERRAHRARRARLRAHSRAGHGRSACRRTFARCATAAWSATRCRTCWRSTSSSTTRWAAAAPRACQNDAQGKTHGQGLLMMEIEVPDDWPPDEPRPAIGSDEALHDQDFERVRPAPRRGSDVRHPRRPGAPQRAVAANDRRADRHLPPRLARRRACGRSCSGAGKAFSAGADLDHLRALRDAGPEENLRRLANACAICSWRCSSSRR